MLGDPWASKVSQSSTVLSPWMTGDILLRIGKDSYRNLTSTGKYSLPVTQFPGHRPKKNEAESYSQGGTVKPNIFLSVKISIMWYAGVGKSSRCSDLIQNANFTFTIGYFNSTGKKDFFLICPHLDWCDYRRQQVATKPEIWYSWQKQPRIQRTMIWEINLAASNLGDNRSTNAVGYEHAPGCRCERCILGRWA